MGNDYLSEIYRAIITVTFIYWVNARIVEPEFTVTYFKQKTIQHIITFACWKESGKKMFKLLLLIL